VFRLPASAPIVFQILNRAPLGQFLLSKPRKVSCPIWLSFDSGPGAREIRDAFFATADLVNFSCLHRSDDLGGTPVKFTNCECLHSESLCLRDVGASARNCPLSRCYPVAG
jgi:hypothetical protein